MDFDEELLKEAWELYEKEMASRSDDDYEVNEVQMKKFIDAYAFFSEACAKSGGEIEDMELVPHEETGGITAYFRVFYIHGDDLARLAKVVGNMSAISIDSMIDGRICISFNIPRVFYKK